MEAEKISAELHARNRDRSRSRCSFKDQDKCVSLLDKVVDGQVIVQKIHFSSCYFFILIFGFGNISVKRFPAYKSSSFKDFQNSLAIGVVHLE